MARQHSDESTRAVECHEHSESVQCAMCNEEMPFDRFGAHERDECEKRVVSCAMCSEKMPFDEMVSHKRNECKHRMVFCTTCSTEVPFDMLARHEAEECRQQSMPSVTCASTSTGNSNAEPRRAKEDGAVRWRAVVTEAGKGFAAGAAAGAAVDIAMGGLTMGLGALATGTIGAGNALLNCRVDAQAHTSSGQNGAQKRSKSTLPPAVVGQSVTLVGLLQRPALNGKRAIVRSYDRTNCRYELEISGSGERRLIKPANILADETACPSLDVHSGARSNIPSNIPWNISSNTQSDVSESERDARLRARGVLPPLVDTLKRTQSFDEALWQETASGLGSLFSWKLAMQDLKDMAGKDVLNAAEEDGRRPLNAPLSLSMETQIQRAINIIEDFARASGDHQIPANVLDESHGIVALTTVRVGFCITKTIGTGLVLARQQNGKWSGPCGVVNAASGIGVSFGGDLIDTVIVIRSQEALKAFMNPASITVGSGLSIAAGPKSSSSDGAALAVGLNDGIASCYSYSRCRGVFAGVELKGSIFFARPDFNAKFYGREASARSILTGELEPPATTEPLYCSLDKLMERNDRDKQCRLNDSTSSLLSMADTVSDEEAAQTRHSDDEMI